ncbi:MAG: hypothetical protein JO145_02465 [Acidobacteriaceae bacterium]|nr:hypothetical protein [Acidobacteriaceae bacterium]MBV9763620.1 hypothetical protein [Acidobacteriaceae bacterium]
MRFVIRWLLFGALTAAVATNILAQRVSAGHASSGGHSGFASHAYSASPAPTAGYTGLRSPAAGYTGIRQGALRSRGYGGYGRTYRHVPYPYFFTPYYYPFLDYSDAPYGGAPYDVPDDPSAEAAILGEEVQRLSAAVDQLAYNQQTQQGSASPQSYSQSAPQQPPVMLVLHSGQTVEVQNYAVMDQTFWDFTRQPAQKIPIANIDIAASTRATQAKGGEFPQLESGQ